jgi:tetratricopeptide (TPR) repeat protein
MLPPQDTTAPHARAASLLAQGELGDARRMLERAVRARRDDAAAITLLGRVHLAWPVVGRFKAWDLFRRAADLAPTDPEPRYLQAKVGEFLGGDDGERLTRDALYHVWRVDPHYRDTWEMWDQLYHGRGHLQRAAAILSRHGDDQAVALRRARLFVEAQAYDSAEAILEVLAAGGRDDAAVWAVRAQAALERGDAAAGLEHYTRALDRAASDSLGILWRQARSIATPHEDSVYAVTPPARREAFFRAFWARREPDLNTAVNERVAEHFLRLAHARHWYQLRHPQSMFHRSPLRRALFGGMSGAVLAASRSFGFADVPLPGHSRLEDDVQAAGLGVDLRDVPEPDSVTRYRRYRMDGRGLLYARFGKPDQLWRTVGPTPAEVEVWTYELRGGPVSVTFARIDGGDMVVYPTSKVELHNSVLMLERDETSVEAELDVHGWVATFRGAVRGFHLVYVGATPRTGTAAVWDAQWSELARVPGSSPFVFHLPVGVYHLGVDVRSGGRLGRLRADFDVASLWPGGLALSSVLAAALADTGFSREDAARAMPGTRRLPAGEPLALYTEIYDLPADGGGMAHYEVEYVFVPQPDGDDIRVAFQRRTAAEPVIQERVVFAPGEVPRGRYRIVVTVRDRVVKREAHSTLVDVQLR